jgi:hypothetical protein
VQRWAKVAYAPNEATAGLMEGLLRETGIAVLVQRASGFDAPEFLAAGPRELMVPETELAGISAPPRLSSVKAYITDDAVVILRL